MPLIYTPVCKFAKNLMQCWFSICFLSFLSFSFIYGDHACFSSILQSVSLLKTLMQCWFMTCFLSFCFIYCDHACISSILQPVSLLKIFMQCWFMTCFLSFCFIYGDHACISSILQEVSLLKVLMQCWLLSIPLLHIRWPYMHLIYTPGSKFAQNFDAVLTSFYPFVTYTVTMHASHLYSSM